MAQNEENNDDPQSSAIISKIPSKSFRITLEFPMFLTMMAISLTTTAMTNVILYRTCLHQLQHTEDECGQFLLLTTQNITQDLEIEVQKYATYVTTTKLVVESLVPALLSVFLAGWSDTHGRKPLIVRPLFGLCVTSMLLIVYAMVDNLGPWWYVIIFVPYSLLGGATSMYIGTFCYMSDITSVDKRSVRLTIIELCFVGGSVVGAFTCSYLLKAMGIVYLLTTICAIHVIGYAYTNICIRESVTGAVKGGILTILDISLLKRMINTCFKKRQNYIRAVILNLIIANSIAMFVLYGISSLEYLYTRTKLNWSITYYTQYSAVSTTVAVLGAALGIILLQRVLKMNDLVLAVISYLFNIVDYMVKTFATTSWQMYVGSSLAFLKNLPPVLLRSYLTKSIPVEDIAKVFGLMSAVEAIMGPLLAPTVYNALYNYTISFFPGAVYILSSALTMVSIVTVGFSYYFIRRASKLTYQPINQIRTGENTQEDIVQ